MKINAADVATFLVEEKRGRPQYPDPVEDVVQFLCRANGSPLHVPNLDQLGFVERHTKIGEVLSFYLEHEPELTRAMALAEPFKARKGVQGLFALGVNKMAGFELKTNPEGKDVASIQVLAKFPGTKETDWYDVEFDLPSPEQLPEPTREKVLSWFVGQWLDLLVNQFVVPHDVPDANRPADANDHFSTAQYRALGARLVDEWLARNDVISVRRVDSMYGGNGDDQKRWYADIPTPFGVRNEPIWGSATETREQAEAWAQKNAPGIAEGRVRAAFKRCDDVLGAGNVDGLEAVQQGMLNRLQEAYAQS